MIMRARNEYRFFEALDKPGFESWITSPDGSGKEIRGVMVHSKDEDQHFRDLTVSEQEKALAWIRDNVYPRITPLLCHTSYGMKHVLERRTNIYMTNNQFKEAMLLCDFYPVEVDILNWNYCVSQKSPIFQYQKDGRCGLLLPHCVMEYPEPEWEYEHGSWQCSWCKTAPNKRDGWDYQEGEPPFKYCPHCGARMKRLWTPADDIE